MDHIEATLENLKPSETFDASVTISGPNLITPEKMVYYSDYQILYTLHNLHFLVCIGATALSSTLFSASVVVVTLLQGSGELPYSNS